MLCIDTFRWRPSARQRLPTVQSKYADGFDCDDYLCALMVTSFDCCCDWCCCWCCYCYCLQSLQSLTVDAWIAIYYYIAVDGHEDDWQRPDDDESERKWAKCIHLGVRMWHMSRWCCCHYCQNHRILGRVTAFKRIDSYIWGFAFYTASTRLYISIWYHSIIFSQVYGRYSVEKVVVYALFFDVFILCFCALMYRSIYLTCSYMFKLVLCISSWVCGAWVTHTGVRQQARTLQERTDDDIEEYLCFCVIKSRWVISGRLWFFFCIHQTSYERYILHQNRRKIL